jgi:hypothetical protein
VWVVVTGPVRVGGVMFTPEIRVTMSTGSGPRVLLAIVGTFVEVECRPGPAPGVCRTGSTAGPFHVVL